MAARATRPPDNTPEAFLQSTFTCVIIGRGLTPSSANLGAATINAIGLGGPKGGSMKFVVYADSSGEYRWRLVARNGQTVASSGEAFDSKYNARRAAENVRDNAGSATVEEAA